MTDSQELARVVPFLLDRAADMCPRRLRKHFQGQRGNEGAFLRGRIRDLVVAGSRDAHQAMGPPDPGAFPEPRELLPEEQAVYRRAVTNYLALFANAPGQTADLEEYWKRTPSPAREVEVGGWIDLALETPSDGRELRQFELWGREPVADPRSSMAILSAVLRLTRWAGDRPLRVRHADLVHRRVDEHTVEVDHRAELAALFDRKLSRVRLRIADPLPRPGRDCHTCPFETGCEAFA